MNTETIPHIEVFTSKVWEKVNLNLQAKSLAELMHEDVAKPIITDSKKDGLKHFKLTTDLSEVHYTFSAYPRLLEYWHIEKESILRVELQYGNVPYLYLYNNFIEPLKAYRAGIQYQYRLGNSFFIRPVFLYEYEEYLPEEYRHRFNAQLIITKRF